MASKSISEVYAATCQQHQINMNTYVLEKLQKTTLTTNINLNLTGSSRLRGVQRLDDKDALSLSKCLLNIKCVTGLDVSYNNITDDGATHLAHLLQDGNSSLLSLDLTFNNIETNGAEVLANSLQCNNSLLSLGLSGNKMGNMGAMHLVGMLQVNDTLQELQLADCDLALQSIIALAIVLKSNRTLRSVDISRPLIFSQQEEWAVHSSEMLAVNSSLLELHLGKMGMTDTGMKRLSEGLLLNHRLRYLDLRCNRVTRDGARHLAEVLKKNRTLEVIDLSANRIEDEGAVCLSEALARPGCSLTELSVCSNNIRTEGLLSLAQAVEVNTTLTHIYMWGNQLTEPVCQAIKELMSSGRLQPEQTDVSVYEVDGRVCLAEVFTLRKHRQSSDSCSTNTNCSAATDKLTNTSGASAARVQPQ